MEKIPSGFDNNFKIANKPGELDGIRNDASIIFHENKINLIKKILIVHFIHFVVFFIFITII